MPPVNNSDFLNKNVDNGVGQWPTRGCQATATIADVWRLNLMQLGDAIARSQAN